MHASRCAPLCGAGVVAVSDSASIAMVGALSGMDAALMVHVFAVERYHLVGIVAVSVSISARRSGGFPRKRGWEGVREQESYFFLHFFVVGQWVVCLFFKGRIYSTVCTGRTLLFCSPVLSFCCQALVGCFFFFDGRSYLPFLPAVFAVFFYPSYL